MLNILGKPERASSFCDGVSRRGFLKIGGLAMGGLSLADLLRAEAQAGVGSSHKAVIMVFLPGGPPHQDMWDIKTEAPRRFAVRFNPLRPRFPESRSANCFRESRRRWSDSCRFARSSARPAVTPPFSA